MTEGEVRLHSASALQKEWPLHHRDYDMLRIFLDFEDSMLVPQTSLWLCNMPGAA